MTAPWHTAPEPRRLLATIKLERPWCDMPTDSPAIRYDRGNPNVRALVRIHNRLLDEAYELDCADWERTGVMGPRFAELMADAPDKLIGLMLGDIADIWTPIEPARRVMTERARQGRAA